MKITNKILKVHAIIIVLFITTFAFLINSSLASDELADDKKPQQGKYSKFFDEKKQWCDALVITCTDFRFTTATQVFVNNRLGLKGNYDYISIPGSIKNLMNSETRDIVLNTFGVSVHLHNVKRVIILAHQDCIGYGGSSSFKEPVNEYETLCKDLKKARKLMGKKFPHLKVYLYYGTVLSKDHKRIYNFKQIL